MPKKNPPSKKPPEQPIQSIQYSLYSQFVSNDVSEVSNTVEIWESIPKYLFTPKLMEKLRTVDGLANPYKWEYSYKGIPCAVKIQPALIEQKDGRYKAFFPSVSEELVEEALKKILTEQGGGIHDPKNVETWIRFSLSMIQKELKSRGRTRDRNEIKHAIEVLNKCILSFFQNGKEIWSGSILQDLVTVGRDDYLADTNAHHVARLPLFISHAINQLEYRQFNYDRLMSFNEQLTRWIYKRLIHRFTYASLISDYHFLYSDLRGSGLLQQATEAKNRTKVISALDELIRGGALMRYEPSERKEGRKIIDIKYTVFPSLEFVKEQKAANKRNTEQLVEGKKNGLKIVDK